MDKFNYALNTTLLFEGGYSNHPLDPGKETNRGVTQAVYDAWSSNRGRTVKSVKFITEPEWKDIYRSQYWYPIRGDELSLPLAMCVFDYAVHSGPARAIRKLQTIVGVEPDGVMGHMTLRAVNSADENYIIETLIQKRLEYMKKVKTWKTFGKGWTRRLENLKSECFMARFPSGIPDNLPPDRKDTETMIQTRVSVMGDSFAEPCGDAASESGVKAIDDGGSGFANKTILAGGTLACVEVSRNVYDYIEGADSKHYAFLIFFSILIIWLVAYMVYMNIRKGKAD